MISTHRVNTNLILDLEGCIAVSVREIKMSNVEI